MKKIILAIVGAIVGLIVAVFVGLVIFYNVSLSAVGDAKDEVKVVIKTGTSSRAVVDQLYDAGLLRNKICGYVYEGETLPDDYICPICKHPASDFEPL